MLENADLKVSAFAEILGNPISAQVADGVAAFRKHNADCIIAIGGGAAMDVAKAIALMIHHPGHIFDYEDTSACKPIDQPIPFLVALPTTSGTGSEVGRSSVISDDQTKVKKIIFHPRLLPQLVLADPELTTNLPAPITAATGMDALSHLLESFIAKGFHPICDGIALEGLYLLSRSLEGAVAAAKNPTANPKEALVHRGLMMNASLMGAIAFQKGLGVTHSCAHALSTVCDLHHGLANGIMLPFAMEFNAPAVAARFARVAQVVRSSKDDQNDVTEWLHALKKKIEIPARLRDVKVKKEQIPDLVHYAFIDCCHQSNPRVVTKEDFATLFNAAY
jgi:alcohol dehydrogenase class IV